MNVHNEIDVSAFSISYKTHLNVFRNEKTQTNIDKIKVM